MSLTQADADTVRRFYAALAERDFATAQACFAPEAVWHMPGASPIAGDHHGWAGIRDGFLAKLGPQSGQTFRAELLDIAIGEEVVVAVQRATADYQGRSLDVSGCQLIRIADGRIVEVRGHYSDQYALDAFWQAG